jgi:hypothetical protein
MRAICILLLAMAGGALAQEPAAGRFYGPLVPGGGVSKFFQRDPRVGVLPLKTLMPQPANGALPNAISRCAVPLIEMQVRKDIDSAIQMVPRMDTLAPMPQAKLPPACAASLTR